MSGQIPEPGNRQIRIYTRGWLYVSYLKDDTMGFYMMLLVHSNADPVIPAEVIKHLGKRKRRRYIRELVADEFATEAAEGSLLLTEHQPPDARWRYFGPPRHAFPILAISLAEKRERGPLAPWLKKQIVKRDKRICGICGACVGLDEGLDIDHVIPIARGGNDHPDNLQVSHASCNRSKGARILGEPE